MVRCNNRGSGLGGTTVVRLMACCVLCMYFANYGHWWSRSGHDGIISEERHSILNIVLKGPA